MKKKLSIKMRITLWYAALIVIICVSSVLILYRASKYAQMTYFYYYLCHICCRACKPDIPRHHFFCLDKIH